MCWSPLSGREQKPQAGNSPSSCSLSSCLTMSRSVKSHWKTLGKLALSSRFWLTTGLRQRISSLEYHLSCLCRWVRTERAHTRQTDKPHPGRGSATASTAGVAFSARTESLESTMMVHKCNPSIQEGEAGGPGVWRRPVFLASLRPTLVIWTSANRWIDGWVDRLIER